MVGAAPDRGCGEAQPQQSATKGAPLPSSRPLAIILLRLVFDTAAINTCCIHKAESLETGNELETPPALSLPFLSCVLCISWA